MKKDKGNQFEEEKKQVNLIFYFLFSGQVMFGLIVFYLINSGAIIENSDHDPYLIYITGGLSISLVFLSYVVYGKRLITVKLLRDIHERFSAIRFALIVKWALMESATFFTIIAALLSGRIFYLMLAMLFVLIFLINRPTDDFFDSHLR